MRSKLMLSFAASAAVILLHPTTQSVWAQGQAALTGTVSSEAEGKMEGVVVTANKPGSIVEVSVTTDAQGRYAFPDNRLEPGQYTISIRAVGYERFVVFGQSLGVPIVLEFALSRPSGLAGLALGDFPPRYIDLKTDAAFGSAATGHAFEYPSWEAARADMRRTSDPQADERRWEFLRRTRLAETPSGTVRILEDRKGLLRLIEESVAAQTDYRDRLPEIACPVLLLRAIVAPTSLSDADTELYRRLRDVTIEALPTNHSLGQDSDPNHLHQALGRLFDRVDGPRPGAWCT